MADLSPVSSWSSDDVRHFGRRAGFGLSPEVAAQLAAQTPAAVIDSWVDGTGLDATLFTAVLGTRADPLAEPARNASATAGAGAVPPPPRPHPEPVPDARPRPNNFSP